MNLEWFIRFSNGAKCHTCNLVLAAGVIYAPIRQLVASEGAFLGPATNNVFECNVVIEILWDAIVHGITFMEV